MIGLLTHTLNHSPMKFFTALADADFARNAFKAAGLDFDKEIAAKNTDCIKAALAAAKPGEGAESILAAAKTENDELIAKVDSLTKSAAARHTEIITAVDALGFKMADAISDDGKIDSAKLDEQKSKIVAKAARDMVAKAGHPGVLDEVPADPAAKKKEQKKADENISGADRLARDFNAQIAAKFAARPATNFQP